MQTEAILITLKRTLVFVLFFTKSPNLYSKNKKIKAHVQR